MSEKKLVPGKNKKKTRKSIFLNEGSIQIDRAHKKTQRQSPAKHSGYFPEC